MAKSKSSKASNGKSNKTAHVLNLLTETGEPSETGAAVKHSPRPQPPAAAAADHDGAVAESIRSALEEDLLAELEEESTEPQDFQPFQPQAVEQPAIPAPQPEPEPAPIPAAPVEPEPQPEPIPAAQPTPVPAPPEQPVLGPAPAPEPMPEPAPAPQPEPEPIPVPQPEPGSVSQPEPEPELSRPEDRITYINVMQALVEDKVDKYMERFGMCQCPRCRTDVVALTLTSLPAKYIVVQSGESVPMLSIYDGRYSAAVTAQLMSACQKVSQHPRHTANDDGSLRLGAPRKDP